MALHTIKAPGGFIRDCLECDVDIGTYADGQLTATDEQLENLADRATHYATGSLDAAPLWMRPAARALLRAIERHRADMTAQRDYDEASGAHSRTILDRNASNQDRDTARCRMNKALNALAATVTA